MTEPYDGRTTAVMTEPYDGRTTAVMTEPYDGGDDQPEVTPGAVAQAEWAGGAR